jgi:hypothetical protein
LKREIATRRQTRRGFAQDAEEGATTAMIFLFGLVVVANGPRAFDATGAELFAKSKTCMIASATRKPRGKEILRALGLPAP